MQTDHHLETLILRDPCSTDFILNLPPPQLNSKRFICLLSRHQIQNWREKLFSDWLILIQLTIVHLIWILSLTMSFLVVLIREKICSIQKWFLICSFMSYRFRELLHLKQLCIFWPKIFIYSPYPLFTAGYFFPKKSVILCKIRDNFRNLGSKQGKFRY